MAMTLVEYAKLGTGTVLERAVVETYARSASFMGNIPIVTIDGNSYGYNVEEALPGVGFRGVNEEFEESRGVINPQNERLVIAGGNLDIDEFELETEGPEGRAAHTLMKTKALAHKIAFTTIKGASQIDQRQFDGVQVRLPIDGGQVIDAGSSAGGDALSLYDLDRAIDLVDGATEIWTTKAVRTRLSQAARTPTVGGNIEWDKDEFGERLARYNDLPIRVCDENGLAEAALGFNEASPGGGAATSTSIYIVALGTTKMHLIQNKPMVVRDMGLLDNAVTYRTNVNWKPGLVIKHPRAICRIRGIANAPMVA